jgi:hypothetical protein
LFFGKKLCR